MSGEHVVPVAPLDVEAAVTLLAQRAKALDSSFVLTDAVRPDIEEIFGASTVCRSRSSSPLRASEPSHRRCSGNVSAGDSSC
jgi:predicted ATPase